MYICQIPSLEKWCFHSCLLDITIIFHFKLMSTIHLLLSYSDFFFFLHSDQAAGSGRFAALLLVVWNWVTVLFSVDSSMWIEMILLLAVSFVAFGNLTLSVRYLQVHIWKLNCCRTCGCLVCNRIECMGVIFIAFPPPV